ncbi:unnamed protein product [Lactuca saligna]|uniref:ditrans,polycis-polyprenyl diphosphate synthase [(2E,6E)-farnesyldiphosphate specific] n=1 Tax=Lactuca saligna TaxID=75948 RepID=A0AA36A3X5_LACSI|nr:unnamed protein product [Lactuca saligna]
MVVLGFNEFMTLLRNPLWLLVIFVSYLLAKALWVQLDIYGEFQNGALVLLRTAYRMQPTSLSADYGSGRWTPEDFSQNLTVIYCVWEKMRAIESYLIENGIVKTYEDLNLDRVKYLGIVVDSDEARETSKVIELLEWLSDVGVKMYIKFCKNVTLCSFYGYLLKVWIQGNKATTVKPYNLLGHAITFSSPHRQSWLEKSTSSSQGS